MPKGQFPDELHARGEKHGRHKLTAEQARYIKIAWRDCPKAYMHGLIRTLAERFNVSIMPIQQICKGDTWREVEIDEAPQKFDKELLECIQERRARNKKAQRKGRTYHRGLKNVDSTNESNTEQNGSQEPRARERQGTHRATDD